MSFKKIASLVLCCLLTIMAMAQKGNWDTLSCYQAHHFGFGQLAVPVSCITAASVITSTSLHGQWDKPIRNSIQKDNHKWWHGDNYLQYLPVATPVLLNVCGVKGKHDLKSLLTMTAASSIVTAIFVNGTKYTARVERPYGDDFNSFPSGHTATAFMGAEILRREYGKDYPLIAIASYGVAATVGFFRMYNDNHWFSDALAGAGIGILSASIAYWLTPYLRF